MFFSGRDWIEGKMNGVKYREILDENLVQTAQDLRLRRRFTFQKDNDPKHTAKTTQEWLRDKSLNVLEWPSQSLNLNPVKHLWRDLNICAATLPIQPDRASVDLKYNKSVVFIYVRKHFKNLFLLCHYGVLCVD